MKRSNSNISLSLSLYIYIYIYLFMVQTHPLSISFRSIQPSFPDTNLCSTRQQQETVAPAHPLHLLSLTGGPRLFGLSPSSSHPARTRHESVRRHQPSLAPGQLTSTHPLPRPHRFLSINVQAPHVQAFLPCCGRPSTKPVHGRVLLLLAPERRTTRTCWPP
jgi:hypothetical protein